MPTESNKKDHNGEQPTPESEHELGRALRASLAELEKGLPLLLKSPSHLEEAQSAIYGAVLTLILESRLPVALADPVREFLSRFHEALEHRQRVTTWQHNQHWFAARVVRAATADQEEQTADAQGPAGSEGEAQGPAGSEGEALELLYTLYPELR